MANVSTSASKGVFPTNRSFVLSKFIYPDSIKPLRIHINPSADTILRLVRASAHHELRGLVDERGTHAWWDSGKAEHLEVVREFGMTDIYVPHIYVYHRPSPVRGAEFSTNYWKQTAGRWGTYDPETCDYLPYRRFFPTKYHRSPQLEHHLFSMMLNGDLPDHSSRHL